MSDTPEETTPGRPLGLPDVEALGVKLDEARGEMTRLTTRLDNIKLKAEAAEKVARSARKQSRAAWAMTVVSVCLTIGAILAIARANGQIDSNTAASERSQEAIDRVEALVAEIEADRTSAREASCIRYNAETIVPARNAITESILVLAGPDVTVDDLTPEQRARYDIFVERVDQQLQFRDCTPEGITRWLENPPPDPAVTTVPE